MRRRLLMGLIFGGEDVIKYGYFDVKPERTEENWQVNVTDYTIEIQTGLNTAPKKMICVYMDDKENLISTGAAIFIGAAGGNGYSHTGTVAGESSDISFLSPDALYVRYDESTSSLFLHVSQWRYIKCGKWMWIAVYDE